MIRRYAVEIYFTLFALFLGIALVLILNATAREEQAPSSALWMAIIALVFFVAAMVATEVRETGLYKNQSS